MKGVVKYFTDGEADVMGVIAATIFWNSLKIAAEP